MLKETMAFSYALLLLIFGSCMEKKDPIPLEEVIPWCIVSFDSLERNPTERIEMLKEMGFSSYGYNWKERHLVYMEEEFELAAKNGMEIPSIFLWLNPKRDSIGKFSPLNQRMLDVISKVSEKPTIYFSFSDSYFKDLSHEESFKLAMDYINFIYDEAQAIGCEIAFYNHHGWFGDPYNQIELVKAFKKGRIGIVYNFHHAHGEMADFEAVAKAITPYVDYITLNGMVSAEEKIFTLGKGKYEYEMIKHFLDNGYKGKWGILGHINDEDVEVVLKRNIEGLKEINQRLVSEGY